MDSKILTAAALLALINAATDFETAKKAALQAADRVAAQEQELQAAAEYNAELQQELKDAKSGVKYRPSFKINKDKYFVNHGANVDGKVYSAEEIAKTPAIQKALVKSESTAITKEIVEVTE